VKKFNKMIDEASTLEQSRSYKAAVGKFAEAAAALTPTPAVKSLHLGMCRCHIKLKDGASAVTWCGKAYADDGSDVETMFLFADAKVRRRDDSVWGHTSCCHIRDRSSAGPIPPCVCLSQVLNDEDHAALQMLKTAQRQQRGRHVGINNRRVPRINYNNRRSLGSRVLTAAASRVRSAQG